MKTRTVSNQLVLTGLIGLLTWQLVHGTVNWLSLIISTALALLLWSGKVFGGGDSKLLILVSTAFAVNLLPWLYLSIALCGAAQAGYYLTLKKETTLPYAVSIFWGTWIYVCFQSIPKLYLLFT